MRPTQLANRPSMSCKDALVLGVRSVARAVMRLGALPHGRLALLQKHVAHNCRNFLEAVLYGVRELETSRLDSLWNIGRDINQVGILALNLFHA